MADDARSGPVAAAVAATGLLGRGGGRPYPLRARVRGLMALVTSAVTGAYFLQLLVERPDGTTHPYVTALFMGSLTAWSVLHVRGVARWATDVLLVLALFGTAMTVPTEGWVWGPCFLVVIQRGIDARPWAAWGWAGTSFAAYQATIARLDGIAEVLTINTLATGVEYVVAALFVRILISALDANEVVTRRERILAGGSSRLLSADSTDAVAAIVADISRALGGAPHATAFGDDGVPDQDQTVATTPVMVDGEVVCTIVLQDDGRLDDDLREAMVRFANEVSAAWQRVVLLRRLRETNDELLQAAEIKDDFIAAVSHELRTPLTSVVGFVDVLLRGWDRLDDVQKREYLELVRAQAGRQRELVDDLLSMSRIVAGELHPTPSAVDVAGAVAATVAAAAIEVSVSGADDLPPAWADRRHLEQILANLLTNAGKYGAPPYEVHLSSPDDEVHVAVVDHGAGVPETFVAHLFDRFSQANTGDGRSASGIGLGLAISAELAAANDAEVSYSPTPGGGATFTLALPTAATAPDAADPVGEPPAVPAAS